MIIIAATAILSACATTPKGGSVPKADPKMDRLSPRKLAPGDCGLFVWTADAAKRFLLFSQVKDGQAYWFDGDKEDYLKITATDGRIANGQYPQQTFAARGGHTLRLDLKQPQAITDGTRFKAGTLTMSSGQDWDRVTPIVGLSACQPKPG